MKHTQEHNPSLLLNKTGGAKFAESYNAKHLNSIECHTFRITTIDIQKVKEINWNWNLESVWGKVLDIWCQFMGKGK